MSDGVDVNLAGIIHLSAATLLTRRPGSIAPGTAVSAHPLPSKRFRALPLSPPPEAARGQPPRIEQLDTPAQQVFLWEPGQCSPAATGWSPFLSSSHARAASSSLLETSDELLPETGTTDISWRGRSRACVVGDVASVVVFAVPLAMAPTQSELAVEACVRRGAGAWAPCCGSATASEDRCTVVRVKSETPSTCEKNDALRVPLMPAGKWYDEGWVGFG